MKFLYVFPDVHLWSNKHDVCFFDTRSNRIVVTPINNQIKRIVDNLLDIRNLYCISLEEEDCNSSFLKRLVDEQIGVVVSCPSQDRPIAIPPYHILDNFFSVDSPRNHYRVIDLVRRVIIHIGGNCDYHCLNCEQVYLQTPFCTKSSNNFSQERLYILHQQINALMKLEIVDIILSSSKLEFLQASTILHREGVLVIYHLLWKNVTGEVLNVISAFSQRVLVKILIDLSDINEEQLISICELQKAYKDCVILVFCVTCEGDQRLLDRIIPLAINENIEIKYIYTGKGNEHICQNYLLNYSDLQELTADHNRIFGNRELNFSLFGNLVIHPDGTVRLNENTEVIGTIEDDWTDMLNKALNKPNPWLLTRNKIEPCSNCIFRDLCPPIRNLELYMGDKLACVDYYKSLVKPEKDNN